MLTFDLEDEVQKRVGRERIWIAGLDEVGVGAVAGPVTAASVVLSRDAHEFYKELNDSKQISRKKRERLFELITEHALAYGIGWCSVEEIDTLGITKCRQLILERAYAALFNQEQIFHSDRFIDANVACVVDDHNMEKYRNNLGGKFSIFVDKADEKSLSVAAASIVAKVYRDDFMRWKGSVLNKWGFKENVGYSTEIHIQAIKKHGICELHRRSFKPIKDFLDKGNK